MAINKNQLYMHGIVLIWGFTGILGKVITLDSATLVWWRMLIAVFGLGLYMFFAGKVFRESLKAILRFITTGICIAAHWIFFFESIDVSTVSVALATLSSAVFFTAMLEPMFFKRQLQWYELLLGIAVIIGLALIFGFEVEHKLGIGYALISAFLAALFTVINGRFIKHHRAMTITFYEMIGGVLCISIYLLLLGDTNFGVTELTGLNVFYLLILGLVCTAFAFAVSVEVMKELTPYTVSISVNMEPVYAIVMALVFFGEEEKMTWGFYLGTAIIIGSILVNAFLKKKNRKKTELSSQFIQ